MNINLHIERLVLDAVDIQPAQRNLLRTAMETELSRLLAEGSLSPILSNGTVVPKIRAPEIQVTLRNGPVDLGNKIATAIYGGIGR